MLSGCKFKTCFCAATGSHTLRSSYVCYSFHLEEQLCVKSKISLPATGQSKQRACSSGQKNKSTKSHHIMWPKSRNAHGHEPRQLTIFCLCYVSTLTTTVATWLASLGCLSSPNSVQFKFIYIIKSQQQLPHGALNCKDPTIIVPQFLTSNLWWSKVTVTVSLKFLIFFSLHLKEISTNLAKVFRLQGKIIRFWWSRAYSYSYTET